MVVMHLRERLKLIPEFYDVETWRRSLQTSSELPPSPSDFDRAWVLLNRARLSGLLALVCYFDEQPALARKYGEYCVDSSLDFFFGDWRLQLEAPDGVVSPVSWKRLFPWMHVFECGLLWGSVLMKWEKLHSIATYPTLDCPLSSGFTESQRCRYLLLSAFLTGGLGTSTLVSDIATNGDSRSKLLLRLLEGCLSADADAIERALVKYLENHRKTDFAKEQITTKISVEATVINHWVSEHGMRIHIPQNLADHIVLL